MTIENRKFTILINMQDAYLMSHADSSFVFVCHLDRILGKVYLFQYCIKSVRTTSMQDDHYGLLTLKFKRNTRRQTDVMWA